MALFQRKLSDWKPCRIRRATTRRSGPIAPFPRPCRRGPAAIERDTPCEPSCRGRAFPPRARGKTRTSPCREWSVCTVSTAFPINAGNERFLGTGRPGDSRQGCEGRIPRHRACGNGARRPRHRPFAFFFERAASGLAFCFPGDFARCCKRAASARGPEAAEGDEAGANGDANRGSPHSLPPAWSLSLSPRRFASLRNALEAATLHFSHSTLQRGRARAARGAGEGCSMSLIGGRPVGLFLVPPARGADGRFVTPRHDGREITL